MMMDHMMMYFHTELGMDKILFKTWVPTNTSGMLLACLLTMFATIIYEGLKYVREIIRYRQSEQTHDTFREHLLSSSHIFQTLLHAAQYLISYSLMLVAMTFQVYLFMSIILGAAIGYFIFTPLTAKMRAEYTNFSDPCC